MIYFLIVLVIALWGIKGWTGRSYPDNVDEDEIDAWIEFCDCMEDDE